MTLLIYDGSWTGLLSSIFELYERKIEEATLIKQELYLPRLFSSELHITSCMQKASRVLCGLKKKLTERGLNEFYACYLSELQDSDDLLLQYARLIFDGKGDERAFGYHAVLKVSQIAKMVFRESHRMKGFVRFKLTRDGFYYAGIEPDFDVIPLIKQHFMQRFADQEWLIYDLKRTYGVYFNMKDVVEVTFQTSLDRNTSRASDIFCEKDIEYQGLWMQYYTSTGIESRKNSRLHLRHVPKRYWKHLIEEASV